MTRTDRTWIAAIAVLAFGLHAVAFLIMSPEDAFTSIIPWWEHVIAHGIGSPVGNYAPPYLYLLWLMAPLKGLILDVAMVKLLSFLGACWLAFAACCVLSAVNRPWGFGLLTLALPSVISNVSMLGQADTFWVAPCLLSVAAAIEGKHVKVAAWAGLAFAVKLQAAWLAPFVMYYLWCVRARPSAWLAAPAAVALAWLPAWLAGWPLTDLLTIYLNQATTIPRTSKGLYTENGASLWVLVAAVSQQANFAWRWLGLPFAVVAVAVYLKKLPKQPSAQQLMLAAVISSSLVPFFLPQMHERYFMLADVLAFLLALAFPTRRMIGLAIIVQIASAWPVLVYSFRLEPAHLVAPPLMAFALFSYGKIIGSVSRKATNEHTASSAVPASC